MIDTTIYLPHIKLGGTLASLVVGDDVVYILSRLKYGQQFVMIHNFLCPIKVTLFSDYNGHKIYRVMNAIMVAYPSNS